MQTIESLPEDQRKLLESYLPKWPQMRVMGKTIEVEQALEIIRRTDYFFSSEFAGGNAHMFNQQAQAAVRMPREVTHPEFQSRWNALAEWHQRWGFIPLKYCSNNYVSSAFIFGPHGWCHPKGTIYHQDNVGKYPSGSVLFTEWATIIDAFPFVEADIVFMSGESCESDTHAVFGFRIRDGVIEVRPGQCNDWFIDYGGWKDRPRGGFHFGVDARLRECYFDLDQLKKWGKKHAA